MKRITGIILGLILVVALASPGSAKRIYRPYDVIEVTETTIVLQGITEKDELLTLTIDRSKGPNLKVGDRVRYDKNKRRLGGVLSPK